MTPTFQSCKSTMGVAVNPMTLLLAARSLRQRASFCSHAHHHLLSAAALWLKNEDRGIARSQALPECNLHAAITELIRVRVFVQKQSRTRQTLMQPVCASAGGWNSIVRLHACVTEFNSS